MFLRKPEAILLEAKITLADPVGILLEAKEKRELADVTVQLEAKEKRELADVTVQLEAKKKRELADVTVQLEAKKKREEDVPVQLGAVGKEELAVHTRRRGRPSSFCASQVSEEDVVSMDKLITKHRRVEHNYAAGEYETFLRLNSAAALTRDPLCMFLSSAIRQGLSVASAHTYGTFLDKAYPANTHAKDRANYMFALMAEKALADGSAVSATPVELLVEIVENAPEAWRLFFQIMFTTGARAVDIIFLHTKCVKYTKDALQIEWRLTKSIKERGKRHDALYPLKYSSPWPPPMQRALTMHDGTFEHLGHKGSIASNANSVLKRTVAKINKSSDIPKITTSNFRDRMEKALRDDGMDSSQIEQLMHHSFDMGTAHYTSLTSASCVAK